MATDKGMLVATVPKSMFSGKTNTFLLLHAHSHNTPKEMEMLFMAPHVFSIKNKRCTSLTHYPVRRHTLLSLDISQIAFDSF